MNDELYSLIVIGISAFRLAETKRPHGCMVSIEHYHRHPVFIIIMIVIIINRPLLLHSFYHCHHRPYDEKSGEAARSAPVKDGKSKELGVALANRL